MNRNRSAIILVSAAALLALWLPRASFAEEPAPPAPPPAHQPDACTDPSDVTHFGRDSSGGYTNFCDDSFALPLAHDPSASVPPPAPAECSKLPAQDGKTPWQRGYFEALAGQRFINGGALDEPGWLSRDKSRSNVNPLRRACMPYRGESKEPAQALALRCCISSYYQGMSKLRDYINRLRSERDATPPKALSIEEQICLNNYDAGGNMGDSLCNRAHDVCFPPPAATRYLGCYNLGLMLTMSQECGDSVGAGFRDVLRRAHVIDESVYNARATRHDTPIIGGGGGNPAGEAHP